MRKIAIYCVNYKSYSELYKFLDSVKTSSLNASGKADIHVFVADNTDEGFENISYAAEGFSLRIFDYHSNKGYFGAIHEMMKTIDPSAYDFAIISNVDICLDDNTLSLLSELPVKPNTGWIAPQIYSVLEKRDRNPQVKSRYPLYKLQILRIMFRFHWLHYFYTKTFYKRKKYIASEPGEIYAGHGSFIVLTRNFFRLNVIIDYPVFLYGEELYLAECCREKGLCVDYVPSLRVFDKEHCSTGELKRSSYYKFNYKALTYIIEKFYKAK